MPCFSCSCNPNSPIVIRSLNNDPEERPKDYFCCPPPVRRSQGSCCAESLNAQRRAITTWKKHGYVCLFLPQRDLTWCMDIESNPGPDLLSNDRRNSALRRNNIDNAHNSLFPSDSEECITYKRNELFALRSHKGHQLDKKHLFNLKVNGLLRYRGVRAGKSFKEKNRRPMQIPTVITADRRCKVPTRTASCMTAEWFDKRNHLGSRNTFNHSVLKRLPYQKSYNIPTALSMNIRAIANKVDELQQIALFNNASAIWLSPRVPDSAVSIPGFNLFRKDRAATTGGGVCVYLDSTIPCRRLEQRDQEYVESIWISMTPHNLPRNISSIVLCVIYHSTSNHEPENVVLREHINRNLDVILSKQPNSLVIITGDFNPTSTGLKLKDLTQPNHLKQQVFFTTRDSGILDWFLTNRPKPF